MKKISIIYCDFCRSEIWSKSESGNDQEPVPFDHFQILKIKDKVPQNEPFDIFENILHKL